MAKRVSNQKKFSTILSSKVFEDKKIVVHSKPFIKIIGILRT